MIHSSLLREYLEALQIFVSFPYKVTVITCQCSYFLPWFYNCNVIFSMMAVLKVSVKEDTNKEVSVTVRLYGPNTEYVINREREILVISFI